MNIVRMFGNFLKSCSVAI